MIKRKPFRSKMSSLSAALIFIAIVSIILVATLVVRLAITIQRSVFDGRHQFILLVNSTDERSLLTIFTPEAKTITIIPIVSALNEPIGRDLHVGFDAVITTPVSLHDTQSIGNILLQTILHTQSNQHGITWFDLFRLYLLTKTDTLSFIPEVNVPKQSIANDTLNDIVDPDIERENQTIQIVNGSSQSGLGSRLEETLANLGCNVIDVRTSPVDVNQSTITYYGKMSYTVQRLSHILRFPTEEASQQGIADIQIIIGKDNEQTTIF